MDDGGWGFWSEPKSFKVDVTPPQIRVLTPRERKVSTSTIPCRVTVSCEVTDNLTGIEKVEFYLRGTKVAQRTRPHHDSTYIADISDLNEGRNNIDIKAYDKSEGTGNMSQASLSLEVDRILGIQKRPPILPEKFMVPRPTLPRNRMPHRE